MIDFDKLSKAETYQAPYTHMLASEVITRSDAERIRADYPDITKPGFISLDNLVCKGAFKELIDDLKSDRLSEILSGKLQIQLTGKPRMITVLRFSHKRMGRIHEDSKSKICTMLTYLNESWDSKKGGAIRVLNDNNDLEDYEREVPPLFGNVFAFKRSDHSWHGHTPYKGERFVVQTTFLQSESELDRKKNRGKLQALLKGLNPFA